MGDVATVFYRVDGSFWAIAARLITDLIVDEGLARRLAESASEPR